MEFKPKSTKKENGRLEIPMSTRERVANALTKGIKSNAVIANRFGISLSTVKRIKRALKANGGKLLPKTHGRRIFTNDQEKSISKFMSELKALGIKIGATDVQKIAYGFAVKQGLQRQVAAWKHQTATRDWFVGFLVRNPKIRKYISKPKPLLNTVPFIKQVGFADTEHVQNHPARERPEHENPSLDKLHRSRTKRLGNETKGMRGDGEGKGNGFEGTDDVRNGSVLSYDAEVPRCSNLGQLEPENKQSDIQESDLSSSKDSESIADGSPQNGTGATEAPSDETSQRAAPASQEYLNDELEKFVGKLKIVGISASPSDIQKIRDKCIESLNAEFLTDVPRASMENPAPGLANNPFLHLYSENLRNHVFSDLEITENENHMLQIKTTRRFDKDEFLFEIEGDIISNSDGLRKNQDPNYVSGSQIGKIIFLGVPERSRWMDAAKCYRTKAVQDSDEPNLKLRIAVDRNGEKRLPRLFFTAIKPIDKGTVLKFSFGKQIAKNIRDRFPFILH